MTLLDNEKSYLMIQYIKQVVGFPF